RPDGRHRRDRRRRAVPADVHRVPAHRGGQLMRRMRQIVIVVVAAVGALAAGVCAAPADAATSGSSYSAAAHVSPAGTISPKLETSGLLGWLLAPVTNVANTLIATVTALPQQLLSGVAGGLTGAGLRAQNPDVRLAAPAEGYPTCTSGGW